MSEQPAVKLGDLEDALMFVGSGEMFSAEAWLSRDTGQVHWHDDGTGDFPPLPEDVDDEDRYIAVPHKRDFDLGKPLVLEFTRTHLPECFEQVLSIFSRRGAYARFKDLLDHHDCLDVWYQWEEEKTRQALRDWCADNGINLAE